MSHLNHGAHRGHGAAFLLSSLICLGIVHAQNPEPRLRTPERFSLQRGSGGQAPGTQGTQGTRSFLDLDPASLTKPLGDAWPTFSGDYTGRRYSSLTQLNRLNVRNLSLAWTMRLATGPRGGLPPTIIGGVGEREFTGGTV